MRGRSDPRAVLAFVRVGRPHFLVSGFALFGLGALWAHGADAALSPLAYAVGQSFVTATQWHVHYANEFFDRAADRVNTARTAWSGGSGLVGRVVAADRVRSAAGILLALAIVAGAAAVAVAWTVAAMHAAATAAVVAGTLIVAASYSAPPMRLQGRGLGVPATVLVVAVFVPALPLAMTGTLPSTEAWALAPVAAALVAFLAVIDLPDRVADAAGGKRTWAVRIGPDSARRVAAGAAVLAAASPALAALPAATAALWPGLAAAPFALATAFALGRIDAETRSGARVVTSLALAALLAAVASALWVSR